jgi:magnesium-protoporphyrin IX monomethyl ester (oxidative) cyclase
MKILLINPPLKVTKDMEEFITLSFPLGLSYVAANLEKNNFSVSVFDILAEGWEIQKEEGEFIRRGLPEEKIVERVIRENPDFCGISAQFSSLSEQPHRIASLIKQACPNTKIVFGGPHASGNPQEVLKDENVDFVVIGEGEKILVNLLKDYKTPKKVKGIAFRKNKKIVLTPPEEFIQDLDSLPFPAYNLFNMDLYLKEGLKGFSSRRFAGKLVNSASIFTSRGCPFNCVFCSIHNTMGYKFRVRSCNNVVDEIEFLYNKYQVRNFFFEDDNFTFDLERAKQILKEIIHRGLKISWQAPNGIRADKVDEELVKLMIETNCTRVRIAIEHGDQDFLDKIVHKQLNLIKVKETVKLFGKYRTGVDAFFILGIPGETEKTIRNNINFAKELSSLGVNPQIGMAIPLPGTEMYKICKENGYLKENISAKDYQLAYSKYPLINTPTMPASELKRWFYLALKETFLIRFKKNPLVLFNLNIVREFRKNPVRGAKIFFSYIKNWKRKAPSKFI